MINEGHHRIGETTAAHRHRIHRSIHSHRAPKHLPNQFFSSLEIPSANFIERNPPLLGQALHLQQHRFELHEQIYF